MNAANPGETARHAAVINLYAQMLEAWNRREADAFAALFAEQGSTVGFDGSELNGPAHIAAELRSIFAHHLTASYVAKVREVRRIDANTSMLRAVAGMVLPGQSQLNPAVNAVQSLVIVSEGSQQKIALLQNTPAAFHGRPHLGEQLTQELAEVLRAGRLVQSD